MKQDEAKLEGTAQLVFVEIQRHKVMPYLEIAAVTGVRGIALENVVNSLAQSGYVAISNPDNIYSSNVSITGSYF
jgi:hypothetical protein